MSTTNLILTNLISDVGVFDGKSASLPLRVGKASKLLTFDIIIIIITTTIIIIIIEKGTIGQNICHKFLKYADIRSIAESGSQ
jgi:hypothetical protein